MIHRKTHASLTPAVNLTRSLSMTSKKTKKQNKKEKRKIYCLRPRTVTRVGSPPSILINTPDLVVPKDHSKEQDKTLEQQDRTRRNMGHNPTQDTTTQAMDHQAQDMTNHTSKNKTSARSKRRALLSLGTSNWQPDWSFHSFAGPIGRETPSHHTQGSSTRTKQSTKK
jgi:hypothetical protein